MDPQIQAALIGVAGTSVLWIVGVVVKARWTNHRNHLPETEYQTREGCQQLHTELRDRNSREHALLHEKINAVSDTTSWIRGYLEKNGG